MCKLKNYPSTKRVLLFSIVLEYDYSKLSTLVRSVSTPLLKAILAIKGFFFFFFINIKKNIKTNTRQCTNYFSHRIRVVFKKMSSPRFSARIISHLLEFIGGQCPRPPRLLRLCPCTGCRLNRQKQNKCTSSYENCSYQSTCNSDLQVRVLRVWNTSTQKKLYSNTSTALEYSITGVAFFKNTRIARIKRENDRRDFI